MTHHPDALDDVLTGCRGCRYLDIDFGIGSIRSRVRTLNASLQAQASSAGPKTGATTRKPSA